MRWTVVAGAGGLALLALAVTAGAQLVTGTASLAIDPDDPDQQRVFYHSYWNATELGVGPQDVGKLVPAPVIIHQYDGSSLAAHPIHVSGNGSDYGWQLRIDEVTDDLAKTVLVDAAGKEGIAPLTNPPASSSGGTTYWFVEAVAWEALEGTWTHETIDFDRSVSAGFSMGPMAGGVHPTAPIACRLGEYCAGVIGYDPLPDQYHFGALAFPNWAGHGAGVPAPVVEQSGRWTWDLSDVSKGAGHWYKSTIHVWQYQSQSLTPPNAPILVTHTDWAFHVLPPVEVEPVEPIPRMELKCPPGAYWPVGESWSGEAVADGVASSASASGGLAIVEEGRVFLEVPAVREGRARVALTVHNETHVGSCATWVEGVTLKAVPGASGSPTQLRDRWHWHDALEDRRWLWRVGGLPVADAPSSQVELDPGVHDVCLFVRGTVSGWMLEDHACLTLELRPPVLDMDFDGIRDEADNCPGTPNPGQGDEDDDGAGDACDTNYATATTREAILTMPSCTRLDQDRDGIPDACDLDLDGDRVSNSDDNCPLIPNSLQSDRDKDGRGDRCDQHVAAESPPSVDEARPITPQTVETSRLEGLWIPLVVAAVGGSVFAWWQRHW